MNHRYNIKTLPEIIKENAKEPFEPRELEKLAFDHHITYPEFQFQEGGLLGNYACLNYRNGKSFRFMFLKVSGFYYLDSIGITDDITRQERFYTVDEYINLDNKSF